MTDYISREAAKNILKRHEHRFTCADEANGYGNVKWSEYVIYSETAQNCIDALPAADVRPVVLCKDCIFRSNKWTGCPKLNGTITGDEFFCKCGIKREES